MSTCADGHIDGLVQHCSNSSALTMELLQFCAKPSIYAVQISQTGYTRDFIINLDIIITKTVGWISGIATETYQIVSWGANRFAYTKIIQLPVLTMTKLFRTRALDKSDMIFPQDQYIAVGYHIRLHSEINHLAKSIVATKLQYCLWFSAVRSVVFLKGGENYVLYLHPKCNTTMHRTILSLQ